MHYVRDLNFQGQNDPEILQIYLMNHYQWAVRIKLMLQRTNGVLYIVHKVYTKAWDTLQYPARFSTFIEND